MAMDKAIRVGARALEELAKEIESAWGPTSSLALQAIEESAAARESAMRTEVLAELPEAVDEVRRADRDDGMLVAVEHRLASLLQSFLEERGIAQASDLLAKGGLVNRGDPTLEAVFGRHDIKGWVADFFPAFLAGRFRRRTFVPPTDGVAALPEKARIALLGDWGTGLYGAPVCAQSISAASPAYDLIVHLGDVYYAGTSSEVKRRFLALWPAVSKAKNRALNSNHEMYSGGEGYFEGTLQDVRFEEQESSCFALQNNRFLILGLDTGYQEHDLGVVQLDWIHRRIGGADGRKVVVLSHHHPFSMFKRGGERLLGKLGNLLDARSIFAWYWAHEHRCVLYDQHAQWGLWGRCVGHSGYPEFNKTRGQVEEKLAEGSEWRRLSHPGLPSAVYLAGPNRWISDHPERYGPHGYMALILEDGQIHETVLSADGQTLKQRTIPGGDSNETHATLNLGKPRL